ncbi:MAG: hypothetical protein LQ352_008240 [Teloschistes flavicans]|nr:MAG: hypothetical protein LQ352_008240 [Teloschistes flavicans]
MTEEEQKLFRLYGKLPNKKDLLQNKLKERKYFDSGDYALSKAGKASDGGVTSIGSQHPLPENIPHLTSPNPTNGNNGNGHTGSFGAGGAGPVPGGQSGSPVKEASFLHRGQSVDEQAVEEEEEEVEEEGTPNQTGAKGAKSPPAKEGVPIRWQQ